MNDSWECLTHSVANFLDCPIWNQIMVGYPTVKKENIAIPTDTNQCVELWSPNFQTHNGLTKKWYVDIYCSEVVSLSALTTVRELFFNHVSKINYLPLCLTSDGR